MFSCELCEISENNFFHKTPLVASSVLPYWFNEFASVSVATTLSSSLLNLTWSLWFSSCNRFIIIPLRLVIASLKPFEYYIINIFLQLGKNIFLIYWKVLPFTTCIILIQKQSTGSVLSKRCSGKFYKIYKKTPVPQSLFNKVSRPQPGKMYYGTYSNIQSFEDVLQNSFPEKCRRFHRKTPVLEFEGLQLYLKRDSGTGVSLWI